MSATNRGATREKDDFYRTPKWATHRLLDILPWSKVWYDPFCGDGRILDAIAEHPRGASARLRGSDIVDRGCKHEFTQHSVFDVQTVENGTFVISNPPYRIAQESIEHCMYNMGNIKGCAMLLRVGFLAGPRSQSRLFRDVFRPCSMQVLPNRPSFTGYGTDATEYAWFIWGPLKGGVGFLEETPPDVRRKESAEIRKLFLAGGGKPPKKKPANFGQFNHEAANE